MGFNKDTGMYEGYIYLITNKINGKKYVGQTITTIEYRFKKHMSNTQKGACPCIYNAVKKYGKDNFSCEQLDFAIAPTKKELVNILNELEIYYISKLKTLVDENGYNIDKGGRTNQYTHKPVDVYDLDGNFIHTLESIMFTSDFYKVPYLTVMNMCSGKINRGVNCSYIFRYKGESFDKYDTSYNYGRSKKVYQFTIKGEFVSEYPNSVIAAENIGGHDSRVISSAVDKNVTAYGYVWSSDNVFKFDISKYTKVRPVDKYTLNGEFLESYISIKEASKDVGCKPNSIRNVCNGNNLSACGYVWRYKNEPFNQNRTKKKVQGKPVNKYSKQNEFIKTYCSAKEAIDELGSSSSGNITNCCQGKINSYLGYKWFYADDPNQPDKTKIMKKEVA